MTQGTDDPELDIEPKILVFGRSTTDVDSSFAGV